MRALLSLVTLFGGVAAGLTFQLDAARAEEPEAVEERREARATIVIVADEEYGPTLVELVRATVQARLEGVDVRLGSSESTGDRGASDVILLTVDSSDDASWRLRLERDGRVWIRRVPGPEKDAAAAEAVAQIVSTVSVELLAGQANEAPPLTQWEEEERGKQARSDEGRDAPPTRKASSERRARKGSEKKPKPVRVALGLGYRAEPYAPGELSHGAWGGVEGTLAGGFFLGARGAFIPALAVESEWGTFRVRRVPLQLSSGWCFGRGGTRLCPHAGFVLEATTRSVKEPVEGVSAADDASMVSWGVLGGVRGQRSMTKWASITADFTVAGFLRVPEYRVAGVEEPLLAPHQIRPRLDLGVVFPLF